MSKIIARVFRGNSKGIGLIETMIAILLLGMVAVAFLSGISAASRAILISDERSTAQSLALSQMEYVKNQDWVPPNSEGEAVKYDKVDDLHIPEGYAIMSTHIDDSIADDVDGIIGINWDPEPNRSVPSSEDQGIQMVTIIIYHPYDDNPDKTKRVLTLQDYKLDR